MKLLIASSSLLAIPLFTEIERSSKHQILGVLTNPDKPTGRGQKIESNELALWATKKNYPTYKPSNSVEIESVISELKPDLVITMAFGQLIKHNELILPKYGWINIHFSVLPKWRGAAPVQHAILQGENQTGVTIFKLDEGMDTGPVYASKSVSINSNESTREVLERLSVVGAEMTIEVLDLVESGVEPTPQASSGSSMAPKIKKSDGKINWSLTTSEIHNRFRALSDNPGVWCLFGDQRLKIDGLRITYLPTQLTPGQVEIEKEKLIVGTKDGAIELLQVTPSGRNSMTVAEFIRGLSVRDGLYLG